MFSEKAKFLTINLTENKSKVIELHEWKHLKNLTDWIYKKNNKIIFTEINILLASLILKTNNIKN